MYSEKLEVGKKIKEFRKNKKITQNEISQKLGISRVSYIQYENGKRDIPFSLLPKICKILDIKISDLDNILDLDFQVFDFTKRFETFLEKYTVQLKNKILSNGHTFLLKQIFRTGIYLEIKDKKIIIPKTSVNFKELVIDINDFYNNIEFIIDGDRLVKDFLYLSIFSQSKI